MVRRSQLKIRVKILEILLNGETKPTRIRYDAKLSWRSLKNNLESLVDQGLVESIESSKIKHGRDKRTSIEYILTSKGRNVLKYYQSAFTLLDIEK